MTRHSLLIALAATIAVGAAGASVPVPLKGFVPDATTATAIGRAVLIPIFGAETIKGEEPLVATRKGDIWTVNGTLNCPSKTELCDGGTAQVRLSAKDGRILFVTHYK